MSVSDAQGAGEQQEQPLNSVDHSGKLCKQPEGLPDRGLSRSQRISQASVFREAFDGGRSYVGKLMVMWLRSGGDENLRLGVIASKRTFRRAVDRALAKRRLREAFRLNRHRLEGTQDLVLVARRRILDAGSAAVEEEFIWLSKKAGILECGKR